MSSANHPFLDWIATLRAARAVRADGKDVILGERAGKEFAVGIHGQEPLLCCQPEHQAAIESIRWSAAALLFNSNGSDWIVLSSRDIRAKASPSTPAMPLRLFIPVAFGRMEAWKEFKPSKIHLGVMAVKRKGPPTFEGEPFSSLTLSLIG
ncbi:hypothetical protein G6L37_03965 [Agrobacterium rubi]|nr:hypothetical protein [Agrobacterium rubi]NTF24506.1 hypothetical protein [Agrobacterium rubi]